MATFTWLPSWNAQVARKPKVLSTRFGDGYEQRVADGINTQPAHWSLEFDGRSKTEADAIEAFLLARAGAESFDWVAPDGVAGRYLCREWNRAVLAGNLYRLDMRLEEVFE